ncbi:MAG: DEAD/DEAH box helicase [Colwellia sp.]|nr:DEAD/DEAH box helicase [Colwellia sp.]MCW9082758.1 DEAD/DEAH box helicase [Colwellia sp.]
MSEFIGKLSSRALASEGYEIATNELFRAYVYKIVGDKAEIDKAHVRQLISVAQYLYKVNDSKFRKEGAAILSMLIDVCGDMYPEIIAIANKVFSNAGDFPNIKLIERNYPDLNFRYSFFSEAEMDFRQELNTVDELNFPLTDFQRTLWENLVSDEDVITVAPTSAGKTHIILSYLMRRVIESEGAFAAVIVPTRALITEVSSKLYEIAQEQKYEKEVEICTVPQDHGYADKTFFVMTQERLFDVLQSGDISFNFLFIDEAHNITDDSRGVLLHLTIEKLLEDSFPQVIVSMPSANYQDSFSTVFENVDFKKEITAFSPVAKIIIEVKPEGRELVISRFNTNNKLRISKGFTGTKFSDVVIKLGQGHSNIIYRNQTDHCENIAKDIANKIEKFEVTAELEEAADYVEEFIHNDFTLASNLRKGVAFHYGPLPSSLRVMIENLVKEDQVKYVACTSTLAEGVNLPAKNLFLNNPMQPMMWQASEKLNEVKINNITGRAGRMLEHFAGNIFIVEPEKWQVKDYFEEAQNEEEKIPTYFKALNEEFSSVLQALNGTYPHDGQDHYKFYTIANKLIKEVAAGKLEKTLDAPELELSESNMKLLMANVQDANDSLQIAPFTLEANPTIGYIQQNKLFKFLNEENDLKDWILPHPKSASLYDALLKVCEKLELFGVYTPTGEYYMSYMCLITVKWVKGDSLKSIITEQIEWANEQKENEEDEVNPNKAVRDVIKVINNDIRFRMANALRCYQVLLSNVIALKGLELSSTKLHSYIEVGASDDRMITLINLGLSREAAKEINENLSENISVDSLRNLLDLLENGLLKGIHPITKKELLSIGNNN